MSQTTQNRQAPEEQQYRPHVPQVTKAEELLYGDHAVIVRMVGTATAQLHDATVHQGLVIEEITSLDAAGGAEAPTDEDEQWAAHRDREGQVWAKLRALHDSAVEVYREIAAAGQEAAREWDGPRHGMEIKRSTDGGGTGA